MRKFERLAAPTFLVNRWEQWGQEWEARRVANAGARFTWRILAGEPVNQKLLPVLKQQTQDHCSYCDQFPVSPPSLDTIEHFRPKSRFPREAYHWLNLYFCCAYCQQKSDNFDERLLRPDDPSFEFERYFDWDFTVGTIRPNPQASTVDQLRAELTITIYRLNDKHPRLRRLEARKYSTGGDRMLSIDEFAYRGFLEPRGIGDARSPGRT